MFLVRAFTSSFDRSSYCYVCVQGWFGKPYQAVGQAFGGKSHSTVAYACEQVVKMRAQDPAIDRFVDDLLMRVRRR